MVFQLIRTDTDFGAHHLNISGEEVFEILYGTGLKLKIIQQEATNPRNLLRQLETALFLESLNLYYVDEEDHTLTEVRIGSGVATKLYKCLLSIKHEE